MICCPGCGTGLYEVLNEVSQSNLREVENLEPTTEHGVGRYPFDCPECGRLIISSSGRFRFIPPRKAESES